MSDTKKIKKFLGTNHTHIFAPFWSLCLVGCGSSLPPPGIKRPTYAKSISENDSLTHPRDVAGVAGLKGISEDGGRERGGGNEMLLQPYSPPFWRP